MRCALKINWAVINIIEPAKKKQYANTNYKMKHAVGIDSTKVLAVRAGIRGSNDISWIGRAANHAAKLSSMADSHPTWITGDVYDGMHDDVKFADKKNMWEKRVWTTMNNRRIYRSTYWLSMD